MWSPNLSKPHQTNLYCHSLSPLLTLPRTASCFEELRHQSRFCLEEFCFLASGPQEIKLKQQIFI
jgi:hypothetical protein